MNKSDRHKLSIIGYWSDPELPKEQSRGLPDPLDCVGNWQEGERRSVIKYLKNGKALRAFAGNSCCRICGIELGCTEYTDGVFAWPEGLIHYVEEHSVRLMDSFVEACCSSEFQFPSWLDKHEPTLWVESGSGAAIPVDNESSIFSIDESVWLDWVAVNTPARPFSNLIPFETAEQLCRSLSHAAWHAAISEVNGRWCLEISNENGINKIYLNQCSEKTLKGRLISLRAPDSDSILDSEQANDIAAEYDGLWGSARIVGGIPNVAWLIWIKPNNQEAPSSEEIAKRIEIEQANPGFTCFHPGGSESFVIGAEDETGWRFTLNQKCNNTVCQE